LKDCPRLFKESDAMFARATQSLIKAQDSIVGKEKFIHEAFVIYKSVLPTLNLQQACFNLLKCQAFVEIAQLCIMKSRLTAKSQELVDSYPFEEESYQILIETLHFIHQIKSGVPVDETISSFFRKYSTEMAEQDFLNLLKYSLAVQSKKLHFLLFELLHSLNEIETLIRINSPHLSDFINQLKKFDDFMNPQDINIEIIESISRDLNLAWKYYEYRSDHYQAAMLLFKLVYSPNIKLSEKIEKLSKVYILLKCIPPQKSTREIEEFKSKVRIIDTTCQIQYKTLMTLKNQSNCPSELLEELDEKILSTTDLLTTYAHPFDLFDIKLEIVAMSKSQLKPQIPQSIWINLINSQLDAFRTQSRSMNKLFSTIEHFSKYEFPIFQLSFILSIYLKEIERMSLDVTDLVGCLARQCISIGVEDFFRAMKSLLVMCDIDSDTILTAFMAICQQRDVNLSNEIAQDLFNEISKVNPRINDAEEQVISNSMMSSRC